MSDIIRIAVDGPGGAGKSTIAKLVAKKLGIEYIDTGAMYRAIGYKASVKGIDPANLPAMEDMLSDTTIDFVGGSIILDGENVDGAIRTPEMSMMASKVSQLAPVRAKLVASQRQMAAAKSVIMDGRDIGTNVMPDAEYKFFMTASAEERADRRYKELVQKGIDADYDEVLKDIEKRDYEDTHRELDPLKPADDAIILDTTGIGIDEVVERILGEVK